MIFRTIRCIALISLANNLNAQNYTSYFTGSTTDFQTNAHGGVCLMGGASEEDNAMTWFLNQANGGDILVLRASGSDGYNDYLYSDLGVNVNSVETIVCHNAAASSDTYIHQRIQTAEAIWFAGGDQWDYISYWRNTQIATLINDAIANRNIVIGGTSAGMAIQGGFYFSAQNGTVTSANALSNPYNSSVTIANTPFLSNNYLAEVITDSHYDVPDRKGRHTVFLSRILTDYGIAAKGIGCNEYTAVCIDTLGIAKVYGDYPNYDEHVYFIQINCELSDIAPESCISGTPLDWNLNNEALKVFKANGTANGSNTLDLKDWKTSNSGSWENWYVSNGVLYQTPSLPPSCNLTIEENDDLDIKLIPNPAQTSVMVSLSELVTENFNLYVTSINGTKMINSNYNVQSGILDVSSLANGLYIVVIETEKKIISKVKLVVQH